MIKTPLHYCCMTRTDLTHCGEMPDAREESTKSVREAKMESRHSTTFGRDGIKVT